MTKHPTSVFLAGVILAVILLAACVTPDSTNVNEKIGNELSTQIELKQEQSANPTSERLDMMKGLGIIVDNLEIQRVYIHSAQMLIPSQLDEIK